MQAGLVVRRTEKWVRLAAATAWEYAREYIKSSLLDLLGATAAFPAVGILVPSLLIDWQHDLLIAVLTCLVGPMIIIAGGFCVSLVRTYKHPSLSIPPFPRRYTVLCLARAIASSPQLWKETSMACSTGQVRDNRHNKGTVVKSRLIIIESPYAGSIEANLLYLRRCIRDSLLRGEAPFASHQMYLGALDDEIPEERLKGILAGFAWWPSADGVIFYLDLGWSRGMRAALGRARSMGMEHAFRVLDGGQPEIEARLGELATVERGAEPTS